MIRSLKAATIVCGALLAGICLGAQPSVSRAHADEIPVAAVAVEKRSESAPPPLDPKRKRPGEACKSDDECQRHHTCAKVGDKQVCQAPPRPSLPPGAVT